MSSINKEKECEKICDCKFHCRCMQPDCPNTHYATCKKLHDEKSPAPEGGKCEEKEICGYGIHPRLGMSCAEKKPCPWHDLKLKMHELPQKYCQNCKKETHQLPDECALCRKKITPTPPPASKGKEWLIWSIEHNAWWKADWRGYTQVRAEAGLYSYEEALKIVSQANINLKNVPNEAMIQNI